MAQEEKQLSNEHNEHELTANEIRAWNSGYEKGYEVGYANGKNAHLNKTETDTKMITCDKLELEKLYGEEY